MSESDERASNLDSEKTETAERTLVAAVVASVAAANPSLGLLASVGVPAFEHALRVWRDSQGQRTARFLSVASREAGMDVEAMLSRIAEDEQVLSQMAAAVTAASNTALNAKIEALGRSLGALAADSARIDPEGLWIRTLADLESPHVRVLLELQREDPERPGHLCFFNAQRLSHITGSASLASVILFTLERHGLARRVNVNTLTRQDIARWGIRRDGRDTWWLSGHLADECLERLRLSAQHNAV